MPIMKIKRDHYENDPLFRVDYQRRRFHFHLHLRPEQLADTVILVGDPGRVELVASFFDTRECNVSNRSSTPSQAPIKANV